MSLKDNVKSVFGGDEEPEDALDAAFAEEANLPDMPETVPQKKGDLLDTVTEALGGVEELVAKIPGYKGYKEKELRREADKLLRTQVANKLDDQRKRLSELQVLLVNQGQIQFVDDVDRAGMKLQHLIDRIRTASYGYAGLFDAVRVKEEQLDALYEFDGEMLDFVDEIASDVDQVSSAIAAREGVGEAVEDLVGVVAEANLTFGHRQEAILQAAAAG